MRTDRLRLPASTNGFVHPPDKPAASPREPELFPGEIEVSSGERQLSLGFYWTVLIQQLPKVTMWAMLGGLGAFAMQLGLTPRFRSTAVVAIQPQDFATATLPGRWQERNDLSDVGLDTQVRMMQSRSLRREVVARLRAQPDLKIQARPSILKSVLADVGVDLPLNRPTLDNALAIASQSLTVKYPTGSRVIDLGCDSPDPEISAAFLNMLITVFKEQQLKAQFAAATEARDWISGQVDQVRGQLQTSERELQGYADSAGLVFTESNHSASVERLRSLESALASAQVDRADKESRWQAATRTAERSGLSVVEDANQQTYHLRLTELERELASLTTVFTPAHAKVRAVEAQIAATHSALAEASRSGLARMRFEYEESLGRERRLQTQLDRLTETVATSSRNQIHYDILQRDVEANQALFQDMLLKAKELSVASAQSASRVQVLDPGVAALQPYKPEVVRNVLFGTFSGAFLAVGFLFIGVQLDTTVRAPGTGMASLLVPELGAIPRASVVPSSNGGRPRSILDINQVNQPSAVALATWHQRPSVFAEAFRSAMASMLFLSRTRPQVIVVTSANSGEGKSTLISNLGIALAETGRRVLIIDGDMRAPRLHKVFEVANTWGLSKLLDEDSGLDLNEAPLEALARETQIPNLYITPSGPPTVSSGHLLFTPRLEELFHRVREEFSIILIDTPPAGQCSDARALAREADGTIVVVRAASSHKSDVRAVIERLWADNTRVLGTILNDWDPRYSRGTYPYDYGRQDNV